MKVPSCEKLIMHHMQIKMYNTFLWQSHELERNPVFEVTNL